VESQPWPTVREAMAGKHQDYDDNGAEGEIDTAPAGTHEVDSIDGLSLLERYDNDRRQDSRDRDFARRSVEQYNREEKYAPRRDDNSFTVGPVGPRPPRQEWIPDRRSPLDDANLIFKMLRDDASRGRVFGKGPSGGTIDNTPFAKPGTPSYCKTRKCKNWHKLNKWPMEYDPTSVESGGHEQLKKIHNSINWLLETKITPLSSIRQKDLDASRSIGSRATAQHQRFYDWHYNMKDDDLIPVSIKADQGITEAETF